jgi:hypothetical protein
MKKRSMFIENLLIIKRLGNLTIPPDIKIFTGREFWLCVNNSEEELKPMCNGEKIDFLFISAENLAKYAFHPHYQFNLEKVIEKFGDENTKIFILSCCEECNNFVKNSYKNLSMELVAHNHWNEMANDIAKILNR